MRAIRYASASRLRYCRPEAPWQCLKTDAPIGFFTQISANDYGTCAIGEDKSVVCWGLGAPSFSVINGPFSQVSSGLDNQANGYTCVIQESDGGVICSRAGSLLVLPAKL
jgi:hypothetical protein